MVKFTASIERNEAQGDDPLMQFVMCMLHSRTNAHLQHWMTASRSDHTALSFYYDGVVDLLDTFVESFQGQYGKLHDVMDGYVFPTGKPLDIWLMKLTRCVDKLDSRKTVGCKTLLTKCGRWYRKPFTNCAN